MPRKLLIRNDTLPYHVTARANNREKFPIPLSNLWSILGTEGLLISTVHGAQIQALVLMPNHIHMILTVPEHDLGQVMNIFLRSISRSSHFLSGRSGHLFGGPYHWSLIRETHYFRHVIKYVYRNPVKAKLCERVEEYPFSTLHGLLGQSHLQFPIYLTRVGMELSLPSVESDRQLDWLNTPFPKEAEELIKRNLRKRSLELILDRKTRRPVELLNHLI